MFRITADDLEYLCGRARDESLVAAFEHWVRLSDQLDSVVHQIDDAFAGQTLGDGIGLLEADGIDNYASARERAELRSHDEKADWRRIDAETLNRCYAAPTYFDARGFVFHLPAFLIAELNDHYDYGFIDFLIGTIPDSPDWMHLLSAAQRNAIAATLYLIANHPDYGARSADIEQAVNRLRTP